MVIDQHSQSSILRCKSVIECFKTKMITAMPQTALLIKHKNKEKGYRRYNVEWFSPSQFY